MKRSLSETLIADGYHPDCETVARAKELENVPEIKVVQTLSGKLMAVFNESKNGPLALFGEQCRQWAVEAARLESHCAACKERDERYKLKE